MRNLCEMGQRERMWATEGRERLREGKGKGIKAWRMWKIWIIPVWIAHDVIGRGDLDNRSVDCSHAIGRGEAVPLYVWSFMTQKNT